MPMDHKFVVKMNVGVDSADMGFEDSELEFEEFDKAPEPVHFDVKMDVVDPLAHLSNDIEVKLKIRKTFDDNIMILDHENIDIIIKPSDHLVVTFPKDSYDDISYRTQERFFEYLSMKGAIDRENVEGGNVYGSLQSSYIDISNPNQSTVQMIIFLVYKWMEKEKPNFKFNKEMSKDYIDRLTDDENIEGDEPENIAKSKKSMDRYKTSDSYGGVSNAQYPYSGFYWEE